MALQLLTSSRSITAQSKLRASFKSSSPPVLGTLKYSIVEPAFRGFAGFLMRRHLQSTTTAGETSSLPRSKLFHRHRSYSTATQKTIKVRHYPAPHTGSIRVISLDRPEARNAISQQLLSELSEQIESIYAESGNDTRALIIVSESDDCFCAGADLKERRNMSTAQTNEFLASLRLTFSRISKLPIPTISAVSSLALGGGLELALCTHFRVFASTAVVGLPETRLAIIPGAGGTYRLPAIVGVSPARDMILTGRRVSAEEAKRLHLCDRLIDIEDGDSRLNRARRNVLSEAVRLAESICEGGPIAIRAALEAVCANANESTENAAYSTIIETSDRDEALTAFREKRKPVYKGK